MSFPGGVIFVNSDISSQVLEVLKRQLFIGETIDYGVLNSNVENDGYYLDKLKLNSERVLCIIDFTQDNRDNADVVIYIKHGLAYIEKNNFGPPGLALPVDKLYIHALLRYNGRL